MPLDEGGVIHAGHGQQFHDFTRLMERSAVRVELRPHHGRVAAREGKADGRERVHPLPEHRFCIPIGEPRKLLKPVEAEEEAGFELGQIRTDVGERRCSVTVVA